MNTTFDVLVIVLSCLLGIFLILAIAATVVVIKVVKSIKRVVNKGEQVVESAEAAAELFKKTAAPAGALRTVFRLVETIAKHTKG
jgi:hypothetical protein